MSNPLETVRRAYENAPPDWVVRLAQECAVTSQNKVAARLDVSAALISHVLRAKYTGDLSKIEQRVRGLLMGELIACPRLGDIPSNICVKWQASARKFTPGPLRGTMHRACNRCPRYLKGDPNDHE